MDHTDGRVVTTITTLIAKPGKEDKIQRDFETAVAAVSNGVNSHRTILIQQEDGISFLVSAFANKETLQNWRNSKEYRSMIAGLDNHAIREISEIDGSTAHLIVPSDESGPKWKDFLVSWVVVYPLLLLMNFILDQLVPDLIDPIRLAVSSSILTTVLVWFISPVTRKLSRDWRLRHQQMKVMRSSDLRQAGQAKTS